MLRSDSWMLLLSLFWTAGLSVWENMLRAPLMMIFSRSIFLRMSEMVVPRSCSCISTRIRKVERGGGDESCNWQNKRGEGREESLTVPVRIRHTTHHRDTTQAWKYSRV